MNTLEQLVRQLEREVSALENRACARCAADSAERAAKRRVSSGTNTDDAEDNRSDTESVPDTRLHAHVAVLKEQLERAEAQLQVTPRNT